MVNAFGAIHELMVDIVTFIKPYDSQSNNEEYVRDVIKYLRLSSRVLELFDCIDRQIERLFSHFDRDLFTRYSNLFNIAREGINQVCLDMEEEFGPGVGMNIMAMRPAIRVKVVDTMRAIIRVYHLLDCVRYMFYNANMCDMA